MEVGAQPMSAQYCWHRPKMRPASNVAEWVSTWVYVSPSVNNPVLPNVHRSSWPQLIRQPPSRNTARPGYADRMGRPALEDPS